MGYPNKHSHFDRKRASYATEKCVSQAIGHRADLAVVTVGSKISTEGRGVRARDPQPKAVEPLFLHILGTFTYTSAQRVASCFRDGRGGNQALAQRDPSDLRQFAA
jgi:hypothetical protein